MKLNQDKLQEWARRIHENACAHGWHEEKKSDAHWLCMVITEVAEAVEADRKGRRANTQAMKETLRIQKEGEIGLTEQWYQDWFPVYYKEYIKGSIDEEFADICIRIMDFAYEKYGEEMKWSDWKTGKIGTITFTERAYSLIRWMADETDDGMLSLFIIYMYDWAGLLGIDLDFHIEAKMRYNETRPFKHNKAY